MTASSREAWRGFGSRGMLIALAVGVGLHVAALGVFQVQPPDDVEQQPARATIGVWNPNRKRDPIEQEFLLLTDLKPRYLPTARNAGGRAAPPTTPKQPGEVFENFAERWAFADTELPALAPTPARAPRTAVGTLLANAGERAVEFGLIDRVAPAGPTVAAWVVVRGLDAGTETLRIPIPSGAGPFGGTDWERTELSCLVAPDGLAGLPMVTRSSGNEAIDGFLPGYLARELRLGERLPTGMFTVHVAR